MREARRRLESGDPAPFAVGALRQTAGYGQRGRTWRSPEGGLYLAVALPLPAVPTHLPFIVGLACHDALACPEIGLKWVNDLVARGRKLGGILVEAAQTPLSCKAGAGRAERGGEGGDSRPVPGRAGSLSGPSRAGGRVGVAIAGIGINLLAQDDLEGDTPAIGLAELRAGATTPQALGDLVIACLFQRLAAYQATGFAATATDWSARSVTLGRDVVLHEEGQAPRAGRAVALGPHGELVFADGTSAVTGRVRAPDGAYCPATEPQPMPVGP